MARLTAPEAGDKLVIKATVLTTHTGEGNAVFDDFIELRVRIDDGPAGVKFGRLYLSTKTNDRWFTAAARRTLEAIEAGRDRGSWKPRSSAPCPPRATSARPRCAATT